MLHSGHAFSEESAFPEESLCEQTKASKIRLDKLDLLVFLLVFLFARKCEQKKRAKPLEWGLR
jgi:hypothetical protein